MDPHIAKVVLEIVSILRAHIANCTLIESASVRARNLDRLDTVEAALKAEPVPRDG